VTDPRALTRIDLLVFDFDGTLVDTKHDIAFSANLVLKQMGLPHLPEETIFGFVGKGVLNLMTQALRASSGDHQEQDIESGVARAGQRPGETDNSSIAPTDPASKAEPQQIEYSVTLFMKHYEEHLMDRTVFFPGAREVLDHFADKKKAVLSNKPERFVRQILEELNSAELFDALYGGDTFEAKKPDPAGLLHLMKKWDVAPDRTLMIGDSQVDIDTARAAGVNVCGVTYGHATSEEMTALAPDWIIDEMAELKELFP